MGLQVTGKLHAVLETKQVTDRFAKREFVLQIEDGKYSQMVAFELVNDKTGMVDAFNVGDEILVEFNLRGREWHSPSGEIKYFNTLSAWRIAAPRARGGAHEPAPAPKAQPTPTDDIPFAHCDGSFEPSPIANVLRGAV
jgi:single-strand DNA-binding protein